MQDKLQELTDRLYNEGLSKGKQEGEELLQKAHAEADHIVADAKAEAERIIAQANKEAEELKTKVTADIKMAATQSIAVTKQEIEKQICNRSCSTRTFCEKYSRTGNYNRPPCLRATIHRHHPRLPQIQG